MINQNLIQNLAQEMCIRNLSKTTRSSYLFHIESFLNFIKQPSEELDELDVKNYTSYLYKKGKSTNYISQSVSSCKFLFNYLGKPLNLKTPKKQYTIPEILTQKEVEILIMNIKNLKHRLIVELLYSSGMRLFELINLKKQDINYEKGIGIIRSGKGNKQRIFIMSSQLVSKIYYYQILNNESSPYLFSGAKGKLNRRTIQLLLKKAAKKAKINKRVHPHILRHSFATHLLEQGTDIRIIQKLLGHSKLASTEIYTQVSTKLIRSVPNPLDALNLQKDLELFTLNVSNALPRTPLNQ